MQAQESRTDQTHEVLTAQQSLQSIQTLLRAGLGCITYLRNLLPSDNFSESYLTSSNAESQSSAPSFSGSFASDSSKRNVSGFKIMTVSRGYTEEADKLLDYLENGIFDALQKQYLRSFIFAIYLDNDDPNNIVEAYTFNFRYYNIPGTDISVPVMSLGDDLMKLSLAGDAKRSDPVSNATKRGRVPTLGEVKRSLKALIKNLIQATTQMDALPRRRYATFKLYYHDHTPDDYEPPYFRAGDSQKDKWFFSTHDQGEVPEKCSVGQVQTGWHAVDLRVTSVSAYLPSAEDNDAPFLGTTAGQNLGAPTLTPAEEAALRLHQTEAQRQDAMDRRVIWDAEEGLNDVDAEGEDDEGENAAAVWRVGDNGLEFVGPIGIRDADGNIAPLSASQVQSQQPSVAAEALFEGVKENVPRHVGQLHLPVSNSGDLTQTQQVEQTPLVSSRLPSSSPVSSPSPTTPPGDRRLCSISLSQPTAVESRRQPLLPPTFDSSAPEAETIDTQTLTKVVVARREATQDRDAGMLDMETQVQQYTDSQDDPIQSFSAEGAQLRHRSLSVSQMQSSMAPEEGSDTPIDCECGVMIEDCDIVSCDGCNRWLHIWCMGYHSARAENMPDQFICFDCRVRADQNWDLIMVHNLHPRMMEKFRDLALFRRAIKICEELGPETLSSFVKFIACESLVAGQLFKRLEAEGFIALETQGQADLGIVETKTRPQKTKAKTTKKAPRRKTAQKQRYVFIRSTLTSQEYKDYFDPNSEAEKRLLGLADLNPKRPARHKDLRDADVDMERNEPELTDDTVTVLVDQRQAQDESQTQPETQIVPDSQEEEYLNDLKRKETTPASGQNSQDIRMSKKVKISIGAAVDLGD
ncbi:HORMA domain-containing protein [Cytidiella melzeri]|nr:HORMA domain-containing protein [Cytidiella melzeri]